MTNVNQSELVIIGAGPSGLAAAEIMIGAGKRVLIIDELPNAGGQFLRPPPREQRDCNWLTDPTYQPAKKLLGRIEDAAGIGWLLSTSVVAIFRPEHAGQNTATQFLLWAESHAALERIATQRIIIATGCYERPLPFPGWTLPGIMGAGAIQTLLKSQHLIAGERIIFAGSHPLQLIAAEQIVRAGGKVAAVIFSQRISDVLQEFRHLFALLPHGRHCKDAWRAIRRLRRANVPIRFGRQILRAEGSSHVERLVFAPPGGDGKLLAERSCSYETDCVGLCYGFNVASELPSQAGAERIWAPDDGGWLVKHDDWLRSSVSGLSVAGELTGQSGAEAAISKGRIAATGVLLDMGVIDQYEAASLIEDDRRRLGRNEKFAKALNRLSRSPQIQAGSANACETILCRCENVTIGEFEQCLDRYPDIVSANSAKQVSRVGMGLCQGRMCQANVAMLIAKNRGLPIEQVGAFYVQAPTKPLSIAQLLNSDPVGASPPV